MCTATVRFQRCNLRVCTMLRSGKSGGRRFKNGKIPLRANVVFYLNDASCCFIIVFGRFWLGLFKLGLLGLSVRFKIERLGLGFLGLGLLESG